MKRSLDKLKGDFKHFSKSNHNKGIITGLIQKSMDSTINDLVNNTGLTKKLYIRDLYHNINNSDKHICDKCSFSVKSGGKNNKNKIYIENKDICFVGSKIKLVKPKIVKINNKNIKFKYKSVLRKCCDIDLDIKHKKNVKY